METMLLSRKAALMAGGMIIALILALLVSPVIFAFARQNEDRAEELHRLGIYEAEIALRPRLERELASARQRVATAPGLIVSTSTPLAQAQLQSEMKSIVTANAGEIRSAQPIPAARINAFETVAVQYDLAVPITHLRDLIYAVETHTPYLFIEDATIDMPQYWQSSQSAEPQLEVRWTIHGYRWAAGK